MIDIKQLLDDYNISYVTEGKNTQRGWINIRCPFCNDPSNHGGFNLSGQYYNCWHCGHHHLDQVLSIILETDIRQTRKIMDEYETSAVIGEERKKIPLAKKILYPKGTSELKRQHREYLKYRGFDPDEIIRLWKVKGTSHLGSYKHRIIIPVIIDNKIISFTSRDITEKATLRYKTCPIENEVIHHKHICYGHDHVKYRRAIIVEGPLDAWRIGPGAIATFGTAFTPQQVLQMSEILNTAFILYDRFAEKEAEKLYYNLIAVINHVEILSLPRKRKDPAEMSLKESSEIRKKFLQY